MKSSPSKPSNLNRPSFRALVAFEAAARKRSFNEAARELRLTPSAISHQIIGLETFLGIELFARVGRGLELTKRGTRYLIKIKEAIALLDEATLEILRTDASDVVTIFTGPSFASKWLLHQLPEFIKLHPGIEVGVDSGSTRSGINWNVTDLAVLYLNVAGNEQNSTTLLDDVVQPMCSPNVLHAQPIGSPEDLLTHVLIHTSNNALSWKDWFLAQGVQSYGKHEKIHIHPSHVAIDAASNEFGIILESSALVREEIASGKLVTPLPDTAMQGPAWKLAWAPGQAMRPSVAIFRDWLLEVACRPSTSAQKRKPARRKSKA